MYCLQNIFVATISQLILFFRIIKEILSFSSYIFWTENIARFLKKMYFPLRIAIVHYLLEKLWMTLKVASKETLKEFI